MACFRRICLLLAILTGVAGVAHAQSGLTSGVPHERELARLGLTRMWWGQIVMDPRRDKIAHMRADESMVYVQASSGIVTAFNAETGRRMWSILLGRPDQEFYPVVTNDTTVFLAGGMRIYAVEKMTGVKRWELELPHHPSAAPEVDDDFVYIGMVDGSVFAYNLRRVEELYRENMLPEWSHVALHWRYKTPMEVTSPPVSTGRLVAFTSLNGTVYGIEKEQSQLMFQFETDGAIRLPMAHDQDSLYVASDDQRLFCLNQLTGRTRWAFTSGVPIYDQPRVIGPHVFVTPFGGGMYCLSRTSGLMQWPRPQRLGSEFVAASPERVYAGDDMGNLLVLSRENGRVIGALQNRHLSIRLSNERTDRIFLASPSGLVVAMRERGRSFPQYHMFPERRPILPEFAPDAPPAGDDETTVDQ
ncbi:Outer membrane protein assembly factor BamB precursor [Maioricimonas rarisocia]|uniref:Outer membrane protein assembly factor BamB n=1 Tax=Maioricimonas rarisocia TaxID=2528026 RepID=A0A517Z5V5_9PLAN|nr:PQQ-binding-like beta-propeller repeat protein [Maioricimonas rarisocia]QDU37821.1 Outer membrane protein assembly factor BamB precursor [Maioricimonas rarisocia]